MKFTFKGKKFTHIGKNVFFQINLNIPGLEILNLFEISAVNMSLQKECPCNFE